MCLVSDSDRCPGTCPGGVPAGGSRHVYSLPCNASDSRQGPWFTLDSETKFPGEQYLRLCARINSYMRMGQPPQGYCLVVDEARWFLTASGAAGIIRNDDDMQRTANHEVPRVLLHGAVPSGLGATIGRWLDLTLVVHGSSVTVSLNGTTLGQVTDSTFTAGGIVGLGTSWHTGEFASLSVVPVS